jgi:hypothetical protein
MYAPCFTPGGRKTRRLVERVCTQADEGSRLVFVFACASVVLGLSGYLSARLLPYNGGDFGFPNRITS